MNRIEDLKVIDVMPGFRGRFLHTEYSTMGFWEIEQGAVLPRHSHLHEQITKVEEGEFELTVGQETHVYTAGMVAVIPPYVEHSGVALTPCRIFDIFMPVREDYKALAGE